MTATPRELVELGAAGVPLDELFNGSLYARHNGLRLHRDASCRESLNLWTPTLLSEQASIDQSEAPLQACQQCCPPLAAQDIDAALRALHRLYEYRCQIELMLTLCLADLEAGIGILLARVSSNLCRLQLLLDPVVRTASLADREVHRLPPPVAVWWETYRRQAASRFTALLTRYLLRGVLEVLTAEQDSHKGPGSGRGAELYVLDRVLNMSSPSGTKLLREVRLAHRPVAVFSAGNRPNVLYRLPGWLATLLIATDRSVLGGGPVHAGDTAETLTTAAAIFDVSDLKAPFADPAVVLTMARQMLVG